MSPEISISGRSVSTLSSGPPRGFSARGRGREHSHFSPNSPVRPVQRFSSPVRHFDSRPSTPRSFNPQSRSRTFESPRVAARRGLEQRDAQHLPRPEVTRVGRPTRLVHEAAAGIEPLARLVKVQSARSETNHVARPGERRVSRDFIQPKNASGKAFKRFTDYHLPSTETAAIQSKQETKNGQNELKINQVKDAENTSKKPIVEYKRYSSRAQNLAEIFGTTQELVLAPKVEVLDKRVAEKAHVFTVYRFQITAEQNNAIANPERVKQSENGQQIVPALIESAGNDTRAGLQALPGLTVELNRALEQSRKNVRVLEKPTEVETKVAEIPASLDPINEQQLIKTYEALLPALGKEMALKAIGQSIEQKVQALSPTQKLALAEKIIVETEPEVLLENLPEGEKWRVEILVKKIIYERQIKHKAVVWEPGMRARRQKIRSVMRHLEPDGVISGAEFVSRMGPQTQDEIGLINPEGYTSGGGDQFRLMIMDGEYTQDDENLIIGISEDNPTLEVVTEETTSRKEATAEQVYVELNKRLPEIVTFAKRQAIRMLAGLAV